MKSVFRSTKKWNLRRLIALSLACVLMFTALPGTGARAIEVDDAFSYIDVLKFEQVTSQKDLAITGSYPLVLCYTDMWGNDYVMTHTSIDDDDSNLYRDGISDGNQSSAKNSVSTRLKAQYDALSESERDGKTFEQYRDAQPLWKCVNDNVLRTLECIFYGGVDSIDSSKISACPEVCYEANSFLAKDPPTKWTIYLDKSWNENDNCYMARIRPGNREFKDGQGYWYADWGREAELELASHGNGNRYDIRTPDAGGGSKSYIEPGCVQILYDDDGGYDTGICWDGDEMGGIEVHPYAGKNNKTDPHWSNWKMYIGKTHRLSVIDRDYTIQAGAVMYARDNLLLKDGVNLTIAPGGILCVKGTFLCNGVINNCGTIVVDPGSLITSLQPDNSNSGQINCYGAKSVTFTTTAGVSEASEYEYTSEELEAIIAQKEASLAALTDSRASLQTLYDEWEAAAERPEKITVDGNELKPEDFKVLMETLDGKIDTMTANIEEAKVLLAEIIAAEQKTPDSPSASAKLSFKNCQGDIVIMDGAAVVMNTRSECRLNLYSGSTCVNNGLIVAPNGITIDSGEFINRTTGTVFSGYTFANVPGEDIGTRVQDPGTASASVKGLGKNTGSITALARNGQYHVDNQGAFFANGSVTGAADHTEGNAFTK